MTSQRHRLSGFTLIEMMTAVAVVALLVALAIPSLGDFINRGRAISTTQDYIATLNQARGEATRRQVIVAYCWSANATSGSPTCSGNIGDVSATGWLLYALTAADNTARAYNSATDGPPVRVGLLQANGVQVTTAAATTYVAFTRSGTGVSGVGTFKLAHTVLGATQGQGRCVRVTPTGQVRLSKTDTAGLCQDAVSAF